MKKSQSIELLQFLKNVPLLKDISEQYLKVMLDFLHMRTCKSGEVIIREGEKGESMFFLFKGKVSITKRLTLFGEIDGKGELDKTMIFYRNLSNILADRLRKANRDVLKLTTALTLALEERS